MNRSFRATAATLGAAAALLVVGCGDSSDSKASTTTASPATAAAASTSAAPTSTASSATAGGSSTSSAAPTILDSAPTSVTSGGVAVGDTITVGELRDRVTAALQKAGTATVSYEGNTMGVVYGADGSLKFDSTGTYGGMRFVDGVLYSEVPEPLLKKTGGKPWVRVPNADAEKYAPGVNPTAELGAADKKATVSAVQRDRVTYEVIVTADEQAEALGDMAPEGEPMPMEDMTVSIVVDSFWLPISSTTSMSYVDLVYEYSRFGDPVEIPVPMPDQVSDVDLSNE